MVDERGELHWVAEETLWETHGLVEEQYKQLNDSARLVHRRIPAYAEDGIHDSPVAIVDW